jgi:hypothetical protein
MVDLRQLHVKLTNRADMINTATARYGRDWSGYSDDIEADHKTVTAEDAASVAAYGKLTGEERSYPYVPGTNEDQAQDVLDWEIDHTAAQMLVIEFSGGYFLAALEQGDIVNFSFDAGDELDQALLGLVTSGTDKFTVIDRTDRPDGAKQFELLKLV